MGLNLSETPLFDLLQLITKIHKNSSIRNLKKSYYFVDIINFISHPYIYQFDSVYTKLRNKRNAADLSSKWREDRILQRNRANRHFSKSIVLIAIVLILIFLFIIDFDLSIFI